MNRRKRRVAVITGTRAEYGLLASPMRAIAEHSKLDLQLVVCGMHLLRKFGYTIADVIRDGWRIDARVRMQSGSDGPATQAEGLAAGVAGIARFLERAGTDIVLILGDRIEAFAGAVAGFTTGRIVAHIHGGDVAPGHLDDGLRHSITKLAHIHLAATKDAARRILRMGERSEHVHVVGAPGLDRLFELAAASGRRAARSNRALVVQHPCGRSPARERRTMSAILRSVRSAGLDVVVLYPNSDRGHTGIIEAIESVPRWRASGSLRVVRSLPRDDYLLLLITARVLVGNSSSGIIEAGAAGVPVVNVGRRQQGRLRNGPHVVDCDETCDAIRRALGRALRLGPRIVRRSAYGRGGSGRRIAAILADTPLSDALCCKQITY
ncbi:MAG: UDP-N-acetylglucosamine 2-epimerase (hydrolyzing) [Phycisphaerales bacterium]|nr:MAG: UDP-N-acetylglucosamine 2-epimerase (hydrolyzing) [Phycisphaerales bacterium]